MSLASNVDDLRVQLAEAQKAQQTAEIALAHEREVNFAEGLRAVIDNAIHERADACCERDRMRQARDQAQAALEKAQRTFQRLDQHVARLMGQDRCAKLDNSQLSFSNSRLRYSPLAPNLTCHNRQRPTRAPSLPLAPTISLLNSAPSCPSVVDSGKYTRPLPSRLKLNVPRYITTCLLTAKSHSHSFTMHAPPTATTQSGSE